MTKDQIERYGGICDQITALRAVKVRDTVPRSRRSCVIFWMRTSQRKSRIRWSLCRVKTRWFLDRMFQCNKNFAQMLVN